MADAESNKRSRYRERRQRLRQQQRQRRVARLWRFALTASLLGGAIYATQLPNWQIRTAERVEIEGNELLADGDLRATLPQAWPLYIWQIEPSLLETALLQHPLLRAVRVRRQLLPPRIRAWVSERQPAAQSDFEGTPGFIDTEGHWVARSYLPGGRLPQDWPTLRVLGVKAHSETDWAELLYVVRRSPVDIAEVDWRSPENLIMSTELGTVHFGPTFGSLPEGERGSSAFALRLAEQLRVLDRMRNLYSECDCTPEDIDRIDLSRPDSPTFELTEAAASARFTTEEADSE
ncbi:cell division protein FtsQ/DivIB [Synechococcus sp. PCC 7336]|uniref:cell division protein FtsQ/DivIB n=1 Tax=Synechococcus sp. PCC 7336 TaxID=195250 RepID=UPI000346179A|nr:FtsQ-type POTRA domain-containing protein [Synechococcus sp. PCC 7336]